MTVNLIKNSNFNNGSANWGQGGWYSTNTVAFLNSGGYGGGACAKLAVEPSPDPGMTYITQNVLLKAGQQYTLKFKAKRENNIDIWYRVQTSAGLVSSPSLVSQLTPGTYSQVSYPFTAAGTSGQVYSATIILIASSAQGTAWFDDVDLQGEEFKFYNRNGAIQYAQNWCNGHNPLFPDYDNDGNPNASDCANFVSQCMREGGEVPEKFTTNVNSYDIWYFRNANDRTPSWTGAQSLRLFVKYNTAGYPQMPATFLADNQINQLQKGDLVFALNNDGDSKANRTAYHVAMVSRVVGSTVYVYAHSAKKDDEAWGAAAADTIFCKFSDAIQLS